MTAWVEALNALGGFADAVIWLVTLAVQVAIVGGTARRVLGVRVGWPRTVVVCAVAILSLFAVTGELLSRGILPVEGPRLAGTLLSFVVLTLWTFAFSAAALVVLEIVVPTGSLPPLRRLFTGWGRRWARTRRYLQIMRIAARYGLSAPLRGFRPAESDTARLASALRQALTDGGVTFVKLGQMLSTRADVLPAAYVRELSHLTNRAEPVAWPDVRAVLQAETGRPVEESFALVEERPLASASVAQVHAATLVDGREVVVKVQRPEALAQVALDLEILTRMSSTLERNAEWARAVGVRSLADGFGASLAEELDYRVERDNMAAVRAALAGRGVRIPWVEESLSSQRVLVMERIDGTPVAQASALIAGMSPQRSASAARTLLGAVLAQIVTDGVFHADLHPGNVVLWVDGTVGLLDFGAVGRLDAVSRRSLGMLLWSIDADDPVAATDALLELLDRPDTLDERALQRSIGQLMTRFRGGVGASGSLAVFSELFGLVVDHGFRVPPQIAAALRSLGALEGTLKLLDPSLDLVHAAREVGREAMGDLTPGRVRAELTRRVVHVLPLLEQLPRRINKITADLEAGRLTAHLRIASHPEDRAFLTGLVQQLVVAVLAAAGVVGGIVLAVAPGSPEMLPGTSAFTLVGALVAFTGFVLGLRAVAHVFAHRP